VEIDKHAKKVTYPLLKYVPKLDSTSCRWPVFCY